MPTSIDILFHENARRFNIRKYEVTWMSKLWQERGHTVRFLFGTRNVEPADVCILHVDLSIVPAEYLEFAAQYSRILNDRLPDIRKSVVSRNLVHEPEDWSGPVIVKTDLNFGGWPERMLGSTRLSYPLLRLARHSGLPFGKIVDHGRYRIYPGFGQVPQKYLNDPFYVLERFLPEIHDSLYCVNYFKFFGDRYECTRRYSERPVIISSNVVRSEVIEPPPEILEARSSLGLDFGKIDFSISAHGVHILDVNRTPGRRLKNTNVPLARLYHRAEGLYRLLDDVPPSTREVPGESIPERICKPMVDTEKAP